jgi:hypothetical protein
MLVERSWEIHTHLSNVAKAFVRGDVTHYQRVVAIKDTVRLMAAVDEAIPNWPME